MKVIVRISKSFKRQAKPLLKKFTSLNKELAQLEEDLINNPKLGKSLGHGAYKIWLAIESKGKGKSGGLRVISHVDSEIIGVVAKEGDVIFVTLIAIYDKSETASISNKDLKDLISKISVE